MNRTNFGNIVDYVDWRGDITFEQMDLNVVDALIFSVLPYLDYNVVFEGNEDKEFKLSEVYKIISKPKEKDACLWPLDRKMYLDFYKNIAKSKRFGNVRICNFIDKHDVKNVQQLCAMTFILPTNKAFISFRGTDSSIVGWKEDFNMSFLNSTPGQVGAAKYVKMIAEKYDFNFWVGGHSKGGNFAVWSSVKLPEEYKDRIIHIYNNDGPGFTDGFINSNEYKQMEPKILSFVPESSIVGVLLSHCEYVTIKSTNNSLLQHDPFSWEVIGKRLVYDNERSKSSKMIEKTLSKAMAELTAKEKERLVEEIFSVLEKENIKDTEEFKNNTFKHLLITLPKIISKVKKFGVDKLLD